MAWTDNITNTTKIRKVHITEMRSKIDSLAAVSCPTYNSVDNITHKTTVQTAKNTSIYSSKDSSYDSTDYGFNYYQHLTSYKNNHKSTVYSNC